MIARLPPWMHLALWALGGVLALMAPPTAADTPAHMRDRAFEGAQWVMATQAARAVSKVNARLAAGDGPLGEMIRRHQGMEDRLTRLRRDLGTAAANGSDMTALRREMATLRGTLTGLDREIRAAFPGYAELSSPRPLTAAEVQGLLHKGEALALFLTARAVTYVWVLTPGAVHWHRAAIGRADLARGIRTLRADLDPTGTLRAAVPLDDEAAGAAPPPFAADVAHALYRDLLAPAAPVLRGVGHLMVVKDGPLGSLPLHVLLSAPVDPFDRGYDSFPWLLRDMALSTLPAVASLATLRRAGQAQRAAHRLDFVAFGNPAFAPDGNASQRIALRSTSDFFRGAKVRLDAVRALPPLPGTERELRMTAGLFPDNGVRIHLRGDATERAVKAADLSAARIVSFATHGLVAGDFTDLSEPALAFSPPNVATAADDGLLTASEAATLDLSADWVVLSACNTASGDGTPGAEGLSGLARAFLFAGARSLLVSHWPVRDDVAGVLTTSLFRQLLATPRMRRAEALRRVMLDLVDGGGDRAHPSAWAPFVVVGEGGI